MAERTPKQIFALIPKIMLAVGSVPKARRNPTQGYAFRGIDDVYLALQGPMAEHGVFVVPRVLKMTREERTTKGGTIMAFTMLRVSHKFYAPDGSYIEAVTVGEAMDSGDKASNKAMSSAMKYALIEVFALPTDADHDVENATPEPVKPRAKSIAESVAELTGLIVERGIPVATVEKWLEKAGATRFEDMPADALAACINWSRRYTPGELSRDHSTTQEHPRNGNGRRFAEAH